jgi:hypothetical protein
MKHKEQRPRLIQQNWITYKLNRVIPPDEEDSHHIISRKEKAKFKIWEPENIVRIKRKTHVALNNLFENKQNPREQLRMMFDIWKTALSIWVRNEIYTLLTLPDDMFYNEKLINGKHKRKIWEENL